MNRSRFPGVALTLVLAFFYLPVLVLIANSFNSSRFSTQWNGATLDWYSRLFAREDVWEALRNSLVIATIASLLAMILGTASAFAIRHWRSAPRTGARLVLGIPLIIPELLMGMSLLALFASMGVTLGMTTVAIAHITFCISYVAYVVETRLSDFDWNLVNAARDLGASPAAAFRTITLPLILPGVIAGGLLAFTLSIDDFVVTFFVSGPGTSTLPVLVYSMVKKSRELPIINALSTLLITFTFFSAWASQRLLSRNIHSNELQP